MSYFLTLNATMCYLNTEKDSLFDYEVDIRLQSSLFYLFFVNVLLAEAVINTELITFSGVNE